MKPKHSSKPKVSEQPKKLSLLVLAIVSLLLVALHFTFVFIPTPATAEGYHIFSRTWGFDHISFYPAWLIALAYLMAILACIPLVNKKIADGLSFIFSPAMLRVLKKYRYLLFLIISILAMLIFFRFQIKYHFLGDMDIRVAQTLKREFISAEYFTMYLLYQFYYFLNGFGVFSGTEAFVLQSVITGGLFIFFALLTADLLGRNFTEKSITFLFYISFGTILLFFGYIEIYAIPALSVVIFTYCMLLWIKDKTIFLLPLVALVLAVSCHNMSVGLLPSFLIILYKKMSRRFPVINVLSDKVILILILISVPVIYWVGDYFRLTSLMPWSDGGNPNVMTLLSARHIWEFLNSQFLAAGISFFILIYIAIETIRGKTKIDDVMWYFATASLYLLLIAFFVNTMRGSGDWDITSFPALIYNLMAVFFILNHSKTPAQNAKAKYALVVIIVFNALNAITWIGVNASDKSIKKIASMLENDPGYYYMTRLSGDMNLALTYQANGLDKEALEMFRKMVQKNYHDPEAHLRYAKALFFHKRIPEGVEVLKNLVSEMPEYGEAYPMLLSYYQGNKDNKSIYQTLDKLFSNYSANPRAYLNSFKKEDLNNYFRYLYSVEIQSNNKLKANKLLIALNQLNQKQDVKLR